MRHLLSGELATERSVEGCPRYPEAEEEGFPHSTLRILFYCGFKMGRRLWGGAGDGRIPLRVRPNLENKKHK